MSSHEEARTRKRGTKNEKRLPKLDLPVIRKESSNSSIVDFEDVEGNSNALEDNRSMRREREATKRNPFFLSHTPNAIRVRIKELDQCCCADVPCVSIFKEYCESSSLHGLRYITEDGRHWTERVLWVFLCSFGFILTFFFIQPIWTKWNDKPTITTLDSTDHPVWDVDFPAVTLCPTLKVDEQKLESLIHSRGLDNASTRAIVRMMIKLGPIHGQWTNDFEVAREALDGKVGPDLITHIMAKVMPDCERLALQCWWQGRRVACNQSLVLKKSNDGFCCSFNAVDITHILNLSSVAEKTRGVAEAMGGVAMEGSERFVSALTELATEEETITKAETNNDTENKEQMTLFDRLQLSLVDRTERLLVNKDVRRVNSAHYKKGFTVLLDAMAAVNNAEDVDHELTSDSFVGFKVLVHNPYAYPEVEGHASMVGVGQELFLGIRPSHTEGSKAVVDFPFEGRSCLFRDETAIEGSEVSLFSWYTQENCILECRARFLLDKCGCLPYFYPPFDVLLSDPRGNGTERECRFDNWKCLFNSSDVLDALLPPSSSSELLDLLLPDAASCRCPPSCATSDYARTQSWANLSPKSFVKEVDRLSLSLVHVYFHDLRLFKYHTDELFSWENILASFGGLIGLCTGFSFLSLAEVAYFFTLRCTLPLCRRRSKRMRDHQVMAINDTELVVVKVEN